MRVSDTRFPLLLGWALLIPVVYVFPTHHAWQVPPVVAGFTAFALLCVLLLWKTTAIDWLVPRLERAAPGLLVLAALAYIAISIQLSRQQLLRFDPHLGQLGLFNQSFWTALHGHAFSNTHETVDGTLGSHFGVHFSPTLALFVPIYALWPQPLTLMVLQALALSLAPVPLYLLLRRRAGAAGAAVMAIGLLLLPAYWRAASQDFHEATFLPLALLTTLWALETRRHGLLVLVSLLTLGVREDVSLTFVILGAYAWIRGKGWRTAAFLSGMGVAWFLLATQVFMPRFWSPGLWVDPPRFMAMHLGPWGPTALTALGKIAADPGGFAHDMMGGGRFTYLYSLLRPTLLLPILLDPIWVVGLPVLAVNVVSYYAPMRGAYIYHALVPLLFAYAATVHTAVKAAGPQSETRRGAVVLTLSLIILSGLLPATMLLENPPGAQLLPPGPARAVLRQIPPEAPVYVPIGLYPHISGRLSAGCWESLGEQGLDACVRGRYAWFVLWPEGYRGGLSARRDSLVAAVLAGDSRFIRLGGFEPLTVYRRRD
jgi:uncharacterized membrane protein